VKRGRILGSLLFTHNTTGSHTRPQPVPATQLTPPAPRSHQFMSNTRNLPVRTVCRTVAAAVAGVALWCVVRTGRETETPTASHDTVDTAAKYATVADSV